jgi:hypothetical protein
MRRALIIAVGLLFALSGTAAAAVTTNESVPINQTVFVPCANGGAGESVTLEGSLHVIMTYTVNDNHVSGRTHFQPQGVMGTGQITGDVYHATGATQDTFSDSLENGQYAYTYVNNFRIIGQGMDNNLLIHEVVHVTFNAAGVETVWIDHFSSECQ